MALFAEPLFGEQQFSMTMWLVAPSDSMTLTDTIAKSVSMTLQDTQNTVDSISDGISLSAFLDKLTLGNAAIGVLFGNHSFGDTTFMKTEIDGNLLLMPVKVLSDSMTVTDMTASLTPEKVLSDSISSTDSFVLTPQPMLSDFIFLSDSARIEITNKALNDTIKLNDWLQMKLSAAEPWSD